ncbi:MAG: murein biosynthesis integral membrane protein MurJ [Solirubrobacterales bacterium]
MTTGRSIARAAGFMMAATLIARLLGLVRDVLFYTWFGRTHITDAYNAAFSIPDLIYMLLVGGALSSAFIPIFSSYLARNEEQEAWKVASILFNVTVIVLLILIVIAELNTRPLIQLLVPDLPPDIIDLAVKLTRIMFFQTFFMALNGLALGILNSKQHFTSPAIGSVLYNVGIIVVGLALIRPFGIMGFAIGVVTGAMLNLAVQIPALLRSGVQYSPSLDLSHPGFRKIMVLMLPVLIGLSVTQLNLFVTQNLASGLAEGSISALRLAQRIMQLPIGIFGISIAMAVFPAMNAQVARDEIDAFKRTFSLGLRGVFLITIPAGAGLIALREPVIELFFQQGRFTAADTTATAWAVLYYSLGMFAYSALQLLNRVFYSLKDTVTPVVVGICSIALNIAFSILLVPLMQHTGLALAYSLAGAANLLALLGVLKWRLHTIDGGRILRNFIIASAASGLMYLITRFSITRLQQMLHLSPKGEALAAVVTGVVIGTAVYAAVILVFRLEESQLVLNLVKQRLGRGRG